MEIKILEKNEEEIRFVLRGVTTPIANALRRVMMAEVPSMAIDDVIIIENSSPMRDEILAHRLGLIPIKTDLDAYVLPEECTCHSDLGCSRCCVTLTLEVEAVDTRMVYSGELKSENPNVVPVSDAIPIIKLAPGQRICLEAYAKLGRGKEHAKWQPVSACAYKYVPRIRVRREKCDACGECVEACPKQVLKVDGGKLVITNSEKCTLCKDCEKACPQKPSAIRIGWVKDAFIFYVESTCGLPPERIVVEAAKILRGKTYEFVDQVSKLDLVKANEA